MKKNESQNISELLKKLQESYLDDSPKTSPKKKKDIADDDDQKFQQKLAQMLGNVTAHTTTSSPKKKQKKEKKDDKNNSKLSNSRTVESTEALLTGDAEDPTRDEPLATKLILLIGAVK